MLRSSEEAQAPVRDTDAHANLMLTTCCCCQCSRAGAAACPPQALLALLFPITFTGRWGGPLLPAPHRTGATSTQLCGRPWSAGGFGLYETLDAMTKNLIIRYGSRAQRHCRGCSCGRRPAPFVIQRSLIPSALSDAQPAGIPSSPVSCIQRHAR